MKYKAESSEMPVEIDTNSSSVYNYIRENIKKVTNDSNEIKYTYDEIKVPKEQWQLYLENRTLKQENESMNDTLLDIIGVIDNIQN